MSKPLSRRSAATMDILSRNIALLNSVLAKNQVSTITVTDLVQLISTIPRDISESVEMDLLDIQSNSERLQLIAKQNYTLSRDLQDLDDKIKMLIKNRISLDEIAQTVSHLMHEGVAASSISLTQERKELYGNLFFMLQSDPSYISSLIRVVPTADTDTFVQIIIYTLFGDQYDANEERLLLTVFRLALDVEFRQHTELSTFMRTNSCLTSLISQYARRPASISAMKTMLGPILDEICKAETVKMEIDPVQLYHEVISIEETNSGHESALPKDATQEQAMANPTVQRLTSERCDLIKFHCNRILEAVMTGVPNVLYGVRWISREMNGFCNQYFPQATALQKQSIVGGYFFLRFLNPIVVTPDGNKITTAPKVGKNARRNLTLIAKVLQNLSNGISFAGIKEGYMSPLNSYLDEKRPMFADILASLIAVEDLDDVLTQDTFMLLGNAATKSVSKAESGAKNSTTSMTAAAALRSAGINQKRLQIDYNEVMRMHRLVRDFKKEVTKQNDPILPILLLLASQPAPDDIPRQDSSSFTIYLRPPRGLANMYNEVVNDSSSSSNAAGVVSMPSMLMTGTCRLTWLSNLVDDESGQGFSNSLTQEEKSEIVNIVLDRASSMAELKNLGGIRLRLRQALYHTPGEHSDAPKKKNDMIGVGDDRMTNEELQAAMNVEAAFSVLSFVSAKDRNDIEKKLRELFWLQYTRQLNTSKYIEILERIASAVRRCRFAWVTGDATSPSPRLVQRKSIRSAKTGSSSKDLSSTSSRKFKMSASSGEGLDDLLLGDLDKIDDIGILSHASSVSPSTGSVLKKKLADRKKSANIDLLDEDSTTKAALLETRDSMTRDPAARDSMTRDSLSSPSPQPASQSSLFEVIDSGKDNAVADEDFSLAQELKSIKDEIVRFATNARTMYLTETGQSLAPVIVKEEDRMVNFLIKEQQKRSRETGDAQTNAEKKEIDDLKSRHQTTMMNRLRTCAVMDPACQDTDAIWVLELQQQMVREVYVSLRSVADSRDKIRRNKERLQQSLLLMEEQSNELRESLAFYKTYLDNARAGAAGQKSPPQAKQAVKVAQPSKSTPAPDVEVRFTYKQLCEQRIILRSSIPESALKHANFIFSENPAVHGQFEIKVIIKGVIVHRTNLFLDELLEDLSRRVYEVELEDVVFSVNLLIHLLNTHFVR